MGYVIGVDIGNSTTETALGKVEEGGIIFYSSGISNTTGVKGTKQNVIGVINSINDAASKVEVSLEDISLIRINEATPVIGDFAMETITETIITDSSLIGHNPNTPGGIGVGVGTTVLLENIESMNIEEKYIAVITNIWDFIDAAKQINQCLEKGYIIAGAIVQNDDGVLINNRITKKIPIVDEVKYIEKVPLMMKCSVEVAAPGYVINMLSNPYGIATLFHLSPDDTKKIVPLAKALIGNRSAVIIKTPKGEVRERRIPSGDIIISNELKTHHVPVDKGADKIMEMVEKAGNIQDVRGNSGTNAGGMFEKIRFEMANLTEQSHRDIKIKDILAVDTFIPKEVSGSLANEFSMENAVGLAAMVKTQKLLMEKLADELSNKTGIPVEIGGVEGDMAIRGASTTPGTEKPLAIIDMGAGSTDASYMDSNGFIRSIHLAGAGDMVTMLISSELGLNNMFIAEDIKKYPLAKVESFFHIKHEDGTVQFFQEPLNSKFFAKIIILKPDEMIPIPLDVPMEKIKSIRQEAKKRVFIKNTLRALRSISLTGSIKEFEHVVLVGGSALDFELPNMITEELSKYSVVSGRGNIRALEGPRNAVATGLLMSYYEEL